MMNFWIFTVLSAMLKHPPKSNFTTLIVKTIGEITTSKEAQSTGRKDKKQIHLSNELMREAEKA